MRLDPLRRAALRCDAGARHFRYLVMTMREVSFTALALSLALSGCGPSDGGEPRTTGMTEQVARIDWVADDLESAFHTLDLALVSLQAHGSAEGRAVYLRKLAEGFIQAELHELEAELRRVEPDPARYVESRELLRAYLTLTEPNGAHPHLDVAYATRRFAGTWCRRVSARLGARAACSTGGPPIAHVAYFFERVKANDTTPPTRDEQLVAAVRRALGAIPVRARYEAMFAGALDAEKFGPNGEDTSDNRVYPPVSLARIFSGGRPLVAPAEGWIFDSRRRQTERRLHEVRGRYTTEGLRAVHERLRDADAVLKEEAWILPLDSDEQIPGRILQVAKAVGDDYEQRFVRAWNEFLADVVVRSPKTVDEALEIYDELTRPEHPLVTLVAAIALHTQSPLDTPRRTAGGFHIGLGGADSDRAFIRDHFHRLTTFTTGAVETGPARGGDHATYVDILRGLRAEVDARRRATPGLDLPRLAVELAEARGKVEALLAAYDHVTVGVLKDWLLAPLTPP